MHRSSVCMWVSARRERHAIYTFSVRLTPGTRLCMDMHPLMLPDAGHGSKLSQSTAVLLPLACRIVGRTSKGRRFTSVKDWLLYEIQRRRTLTDTGCKRLSRARKKVGKTASVKLRAGRPPRASVTAASAQRAKRRQGLQPCAFCHRLPRSWCVCVSWARVRCRLPATSGEGYASRSNSVCSLRELLLLCCHVSSTSVHGATPS